jgi:Protein of unknown function (DUF3267).
VEILCKDGTVKQKFDSEVYMEKFLTPKFAILLLLTFLLLIVHEFGHYLAYRLLGFQARVRKSIFTPGIDPKEMIVVTRLQGLFIALNGFILSTLTVVLLSFIMNYSLWFVLFIGSLAGSCVDFIWAFGMLFQKKVKIQGK